MTKTERLALPLLRLKGKTILVTGATSGYGQAITTLAIAEGARVVATGRSEAKLAPLRAMFTAQQLYTLVMDVRDHTQVTAAISSLPDSWKALDGLVNNAGLALGMAPAQKGSMEQWSEMVDTNIKGVLHCTHEVLAGMVARNAGHVVMIGSMAGSYAYPGGNVYGGTKAFVKHFAMNLRADLLGSRVRVTCVEPGMSAGSQFSQTRFAGDEAKAASVYAGTEPLWPEDVAECVVWALSLPPHVNIDSIAVMPTYQAPAALAVHREA
ncbi:MAG: SDR family NAD(P)-dependent oxidoreductase [Rickettsiales bacterium]|nr:SDR family NAD(P)-dependent oxidoreductase [Rickettsiales bacterium]